MGVLYSKEVAEQRRGPTFEGDGTFHRRYTRVFQVITDSYFTGGLQALVQGTAIPPLYTFYDTRPQGGVEYDLGALLLGYDVYTPDNDTPNRWLVRCDYASRGLDPDKVSAGRGTAPSHEGGGNHNENPILAPPKISYRNSPQRRTARTAYGFWAYLFLNEGAVDPHYFAGSVPIVNSANQAYNPGPEVSAPQKTLTIVRNEPVYNVNDAMLYEEKINSAPWLGFPTGTVKCDFIDGENAFENGIAYAVVTYQFSIRRESFNPDSPGEPWDWAVVDQGTYYLDDNQDEKSFQDSNGNPKPSGFLDGAGGQLGDTADPIIHAYRVYDRADFNALGLP